MYIIIVAFRMRFFYYFARIICMQVACRPVLNATSRQRIDPSCWKADVILAPSPGSGVFIQMLWSIARITNSPEIICTRVVVSLTSSRNDQTIIDGLKSKSQFIRSIIYIFTPYHKYRRKREYNYGV